MKFRKDINGLRAIAVIAVVLFHFNPVWVPGGFAGVDVFFVISGFLMTAIIFRGIEQNNFSIVNFYISRANRIIPALAGVCVVISIFGWFYLAPLDYKTLGKEIGRSIRFISNIKYWHDLGYFDAGAHKKWLLHTWSLSVEWQFYLIYPAILLVIKRFLPLALIKKLVILSLLVSFGYCIFITQQSPSKAFFLLPTRAWEMLLGGIAFLYPLQLKSENNKRLLEYTGLALILGSYIFLSEDNLWPGYLAMIPVMGAFLLIQANRDDSFITNNVFSQKIGKWSYSIYLYHWPIVVAMAYYSLGQKYVYFGILLSVLLGFLSFKYIESIKFKRDFNRKLDYFKCVPIYIFIFTLLLGKAIYKTDGFVWHYPENIQKVSSAVHDKNPYECLEQEFRCDIGNQQNIKAIIVGDSHSDAITTGLAAAFDLDKEGIISLSRSGCQFIVNMKQINPTENCFSYNKKRLDFLINNYQDVPVFWVGRANAILFDSNEEKKNNNGNPIIYFTQRYSHINDKLLAEFVQNLRETFKLISKDREVYALLPIPEMGFDVPKEKSLRLMEDNNDVVTISRKEYEQRSQVTINLFKDAIKKLDHLKLLNPAKYLCDKQYCYGEYNGMPIYYDDDHMNEYGNKLLTPMFKKALENEK